MNGQSKPHKTDSIVRYICTKVRIVNFARACYCVYRPRPKHTHTQTPSTDLNVGCVFQHWTRKMRLWKKAISWQRIEGNKKPKWPNLPRSKSLPNPAPRTKWEKKGNALFPFVDRKTLTTYIVSNIGPLSTSVDFAGEETKSKERCVCLQYISNIVHVCANRIGLEKCY